MKNTIRLFFQKSIRLFSILAFGKNSDVTRIIENDKSHNLLYNKDEIYGSTIDSTAKLYSKYRIIKSSIGRYTYISENSVINETTIGSFCSIGPNLICGWGIHPTHAVSTSPMFYSTKKQNGVTLCDTQTFDETKAITIGNDVFIGINVVILDGITIGDGAIIGAGSIVTKDVAPYAIVGGNPAKLIKYRFEDNIIEKLLDISWWKWDVDKLETIITDFEDINSFVEKHFISK